MPDDEVYLPAAEAEPVRPKRVQSPEHRAAIAAAKKAKADRKKTVAASPALTPPPAISPKTGLSADEMAVMDLTRRLAEAKARIKLAEISDASKMMVHQEIVVDVFNTKRQYVELTPSMCGAKNCPWDAAKEAGCAAWDAAPVDQMMPDGKTFGQRLIEMAEYHRATAHTQAALNDHIVSAKELESRQWKPGNTVKGEFLQGAK